MYARLAAFVIWSFVAATAVFWALRFGVTPAPVPPNAVAIGKTSPLRGDLTRLFGAAPLIAAAGPEAAPEAASRFRLIGVMAPKRAGETAPYGLALIAVDGKPAKAFRVGSSLDDGLVLQSVGLRTAAIGPRQGERSVLLELPALPAPATGSLPPPGAPVNVAPVRVAPPPMTAPPGARAVPAAAPPSVGVPVPAIVPSSPPPPGPSLRPVPEGSLPARESVRSQ